MDPQHLSSCKPPVVGEHTHMDTERPERFASLSLGIRSPRPALDVSSARRPVPGRQATRPVHGPPIPVAVQSRLVPGNVECTPREASTAVGVPHSPQIKEQSKGLPSKVWSTIGAIAGGLFGVARTSAAIQSAVHMEGRVFPSMLPGRLPAGKGRGPTAAGARKPAIVWFRDDLRLHDHEALTTACKNSTSVLPVYCFDPRDYGRTDHGHYITGPVRARVLLDSVAELRAQLRKLGSELVLRNGRPEDVLAELVKRLGAGAVYCRSGVTCEERKVVGAVQAAVRAEGAEFHAMWGGSLFHLDDLPCALDALPHKYADFARKLSGVKVREPLSPPQQLKGVPLGSVEPGELPSLQELGYGREALRKCAGPTPHTASMRGGEAQALRDLQAFMGQISRSQSPSRELDAAYGHISSWLSLGCISPRRMYHDLHKLVEAARRGQQCAQAGKDGKQPGTAFAMFELMWRDFFLFQTRKYALVISAKNRQKALAARGGSRRPAAQPAPLLGMAPA